VICTACPELFAHDVHSCQPKICDRETEAAVETQNILWFEISVINTHGVTVLDSFEQLKKYVFDESIFTKIPPLMKYLGEKVAVFTIIHDYICKVFVFDNSM
jgi:hypothetical protein